MSADLSAEQKPQISSQDIERNEYITASEVLKHSVAQAIAERPPALSPFEKVVRKKAPANVGVLKDESNFYQSASASISPSGEIESADIVTLWGKDQPRRAPDSHIEFSSDGALITEDGKETSHSGLRIAQKATVSPDGVEAEIEYSGIVNAWNDWNRTTARSWDKRPEIIDEPPGQDNIKVSVAYGANGTLKDVVLSSSVIDAPIDLTGRLPSQADIERTRGKLSKLEELTTGKSIPSADELLSEYGARIQDENGTVISIDLGPNLFLQVYPGVVRADKKTFQNLPTLLPEGTPYGYTLRFRLGSKNDSDQYDRNSYPEVLATIGILPNLNPTLTQIVEKGSIGYERPLEMKNKRWF